MIIIDWIINNVTFLTLLVTAALMFITLVATLITRKMLQVSSRPTIIVDPKAISIHPGISSDLEISGSDDVLKNERYCVSIDCELSNVGNNTAQNIYLDAEVKFKTKKPLGYSSLPIHLPEFIPFLSQKNPENTNAPNRVPVRFDNYVAREIIADFFSLRSTFKGFPFLPSKKEINNPDLWPSPKIIINCFYSDIQRQNYLSSLQLFFHIWKDSNNKKYAIYLLNFQEIGFLGIKKVSARYRRKHIKTNRHLRYSAFSGERHSRDEILLLAKKPAEKMD